MDFGAPLEVWVLVPEEGHRAAQLHVGEDILFAAVLGQEYKLSLGRIRRIPIKIGPPGNPPFPLSPLIPPRHQRHLTRIIHPRMCKINHHKARNKACDPLVGLEFNKIIHPVTVIHVREALVFHQASTGDELLEGVSEIVLVAEVEVFGGEHLLEAVEVDFVLRGLLVGQAEELDFLDLENLAVVDLANY